MKLYHWKNQRYIQKKNLTKNQNKKTTFVLKISNQTKIKKFKKKIFF